MVVIEMSMWGDAGCCVRSRQFIATPETAAFLVEGIMMSPGFRVKTWMEVSALGFISSLDKFLNCF